MPEIPSLIEARDRVWIPAVPLPYLGWRTDRCQCGQRFRGKNRNPAYELHWRVKHEPELDPNGPRASVEVSRDEAMQVYEAVSLEQTNEEYWRDPRNRQWARYSSVYDDRGGC